MSVTLLLQERLAEADRELSTMEQIAVEENLSDNQKLMARYLSAQAKLKKATEEVDGLKSEIKKVLDEGEVIEIPTLGRIEYQITTRHQFDWKKANMAGLFTTEQAQPFMKSTQVEAVVFRKETSK